MGKNEIEFTQTFDCIHCGNNAPMKIVARYSEVGSEVGEFDQGNVFELIACPACHKIILRKYYWHELTIDDIEYKILYPVNTKIPIGLPDNIKRAYLSSVKVKNIDANAYAVLLGRTIEMVCEDRQAKGDTLAKKLSDLSVKGEIPKKLVNVANNLRNLRNIGAHPSLGELTEQEIPILDNLCRAILEYVYSAPSLVKQAQEILERIKGKV